MPTCMGQPLRMFEPERIYFITNRTLQGRLLMRPSKTINNTIGGVIAKAQKRYAVDIFAFVFTSNHFHIMLRAKEGQISNFMMYLESNIARKVGREVDWRGKFWERRFSAEPILDDDALLGRMHYIFSHGVKEGLVETPEQWPGLTSIPEIVHGMKRLFPWYDWSKFARARQRKKHLTRNHFVGFHKIILSRLPAFEEFNEKDYQALMSDVLNQAKAHGREEHGHKNVLGKQRILNQHPHTKPKVVKRSNRPLCHTTCPVIRQRFKESYRAFKQAYEQASAAFRSGEWDIAFPAFSFKPPIPYYLLVPEPI